MGFIIYWALGDEEWKGEAYLGPSRTSTMELFSKNDIRAQRLQQCENECPALTVKNVLKINRSTISLTYHNSCENVRDNLNQTINRISTFSSYLQMYFYLNLFRLRICFSRFTCTLVFEISTV